MIVLVGGMPRSGSTFSFNIVREILSAEDRVLTMASDSFSEVISNWNGEKHVIVKSHTPDEALTKLILTGGCACICTYRRPEDALTSWIKVFGRDLSESLAFFERWMQWHRLVYEDSLNVPFSTIEMHPLKAILQIQRYITGRVRPLAALSLRHRYNKRLIFEETKKLERGVDTVDIGFSYYDKTTFFHRSHVSLDGPIDPCRILSQEEIEIMRRRLSPYVDDRGAYELPIGGVACQHATQRILKT